MAKRLRKKSLKEQFQDRDNKGYKAVEETQDTKPISQRNQQVQMKQASQPFHQQSFESRVNELYQQNMMNTKPALATVNNTRTNTLLNAAKTYNNEPIVNRDLTPVDYKENNFRNSTGFVGKKFGAGVLQGVTGLGQAGLTDTALQLRKGENKNLAQSVSDIFKPSLPGAGMVDTIKENINIVRDKDKNIWQKISGVGINSTSDAVNSLPFKQKTNAAIQLVGNFLKDKNTSDKVLDLDKAISKPSEKVNESLAKEEVNYGGVTRTVGNAMQSVGNMTPSIIGSVATGNPSVSLGLMTLSAKGSSTQEALNKGADLEQAVQIGDTKGMIELGTEMLTGGVNIFGKGALDDVIDDVIIKNVKNEVKRFFVQQGINASGEILEETISDILGTVIDKGTVDPNASYSWKDWSDTAKTTVLSTYILNALTGGLVGDVRAGQNRNELRQEVENRNLNPKLAQELNDKIQSGEIETREQLYKEFPSTQEIIDKADLTDEERNALKRFAERNNLNPEQVQSLIDSDSEQKLQRKQNEQLDEMLSELPIEQAQDIIIQAGENNLSFEETSNLINEAKENNERSTTLFRSIDEFNNSRKGNEKIIDINDEQTRKNIEAIQQVAKDRKINIKFDESRFKSSSENAFYEYDKDGKLARVVLNPHTNTKKYVQNLVMHEMYHSFTNQNKEGKDLKLKDKLRNTIIDNAQRKTEFEDSINDLYNTYGKTYASQLLGKNVQDVEIIQERDGESFIGKVTFEDGTTQDLRKDKKFNNQMYDMIEEEAVANILGEKLGNQEFVEELVNGKYKAENRSLVEKIYDFVKNQINRFTGYKDQEQYWKHVKELFDNAYRNSEKNQGQNFSKEATAMTNITDSQGRNLSQGQVDYFKDSKVRDENGNLIPMYHGTPNGDFTIFNSGSYFTSNPEYADRYQIPLQSSLSTGKETKNPKTYESYLNIKKPFDTKNDSKAKEIFENEFMFHYGNGTPLMESGYPDWVDGMDLQEFLEEKYPEYDGLILDEGGEYNDKGEVVKRGLSYVVFNPNQVKNTDNLNPTESNDIRYSKETPIETRKDGTLLALHNLTADKLKGVLELGGFAMPSIAVTNKYNSNSNYGDISVVFNKNTIDPEQSNYNKVYSRDAYTPRTPKMMNPLNSKGIKELAEKLNTSPSMLEANEFDNVTIDQAVDNIKWHYNIAEEYAKNNNIDYEKSYYNKLDKLSSYYKNEEMQKFIRDNDITIEKLANNESLTNDFKELIKEYYNYNNDSTPKFIKNITEQELSKIDYIIEQYANGENNNLLEDYESSFNTVKNPTQELDEHQTQKNLKAVLENDENYTKYVKDLITPAFESKKYVRNNQNYYTNSGNPRNFNQLYDEYTLENLVNIMRELNDTGSEASGFQGISELAGNVSKRFKSINEIKQNENMLQSFSDDEYSELFKQYTDRLNDLSDNAINRKGDGFNYFILKDGYVESLGNIARKMAEGKKITTKNVISEMKKNYFDVTESEANELINLLNELQSLPTEYFEAKPQRAVGLDEVKALVIPSDLDADLKQQLQDKGMRLIEYDKNIEGDREAKLKGAELQDLRFSKDTTGAWNNFIEKYFKNEGTGTAIKDMKKLPTKQYTIQDFEEVINNSANIPETDKADIMKDLETIEFNKESLDWFKDYVEQLDTGYKEYAQEQEKQRFNQKNYKDEGRAELISKKRKEFNKNMKYDDSVIAELDEIIPRNRNGKRTVQQWKNMAKQIGQRIADLSPEKIEDIAVKSYYDLEPTKAITRYDNVNKTNMGFEQLYANDWVNAVYEGVRENIKYSMETSENNKETNVELPKQKKTLNPTEIANLTKEDVSTTPTLPNKTYKKGDKESHFVNNINKVGFLDESTKKELTSDENVQYYNKITNAETMAKAYKDLQDNGKAETMNWFAKDTKNADAEDVAKGWILMKQYADKGDTNSLVNVARKMRKIGSEAGQAVQAFNIMSRLTPEGMVAYTQGELDDAYNEMIKGKTKKWIDQHKGDFDLSQEEIAFIMDTMQNLPAENPDTNNYERKVALGQIQKLFTDKIPAERNGIKAWMRISMLFNPKTQVRNVAGNAAVIPVNMFSDFLGSKVDKFISRYTGVRTLGNPNVKNYLKGMKDGFYQSYNDFRLGINTRDIEQNKFEFGNGKAFKDSGIGKGLNRVDNLLNFVMDFGDRGFSQAAFVNSINNQMVLNNVTQPTQEMIDIATKEALSRTWNDNNDYTKLVLNIRSALNKVGTKSYGLGDILIPFAKTPANLTKAIVDYSPVGLAKSILEINGLKNAIQTGQITSQMQHDFVDRLGKGLAGSLLYVAGYALAKAGITSGEPDDDKDVKNFMRNSLGIAPYSIKIGDKTFTYDWSQPIATPLAITANLYKMNQENPDAKMIDKVLNAVDIGTNQLLEQSFMESINEVLNGNGTVTERVQKAILDLPARAIPTFSKQVADLVDGTQRTTFEYGNPTQSAINSMKAKLPGLSKTLTPSVDTLGNEIQKYGGENNWFNVFFNPANMNKGEKTAAGQEIYDVYMETGDTTIFPTTAPYYVTYDGDKITMDSKQRAEYQKVSGNYTENAINKLLNDSDYNRLEPEDKAEIISQVVKDSGEKAKRDVLDINNKSSDLELIDQVGADYYTYKASTKGLKTDAEQCSVLKSKNYSNKNKQAIYESEINNKDKTFNGLKEINSNFNMNSYSDFKSQTFSGENRKDDMVSYINGLKLNDNEKLYIIGKNYKLGTTDRALLENSLKGKMTTSEINELMDTLK